MRKVWKKEKKINIFCASELKFHWLIILQPTMKSYVQTSKTTVSTCKIRSR